MWFYIVVVALVVIGIAGGFFAGGIFTIVLLPLAAILLIGSVVSRYLGSAIQPPNPTVSNESPLPHQHASAEAHVPNSPDRLIEERQVSQ